MSEENITESISHILSVLGDNTKERELTSNIVDDIISNRGFKLDDPDNACVHYNVYFKKLVNAIEESYAEKIIEEYEIDLSGLSDRNKFLFKKLYTSWSTIERSISNYMISLNGTSMLSTDYARDVVRNYKKALLSNVDFDEFCDMSKLPCVPDSIKEYPEEREWYQPPVGSKLDWLRFAYAIETNNIVLQIDACAKIILELERGGDY